MQLKFCKMGRQSSDMIIANIIRLLLCTSIVISFINKNHFNFFTGILTLFLTFLPYIIARKNHIVLPSGFFIIILLFIFAANYLGELKSYYLKFWWWDLMLHTLSGVILGFTGFLLVYILNKEEKVNVFLSPIFMSAFAFCFAVSIGALWEIFEFSMDSIFGLNMQKSGLVDTMWDLIVDSAGAVVASTYGFLYEKYGKGRSFKKFMTRFFKMNPEIFNKGKSEDSKQ